MCRIDLNCDIGEGFGIYSFGQDEELIHLITSANIACGFHAGDPNQMVKTVELCLVNDVAIGAHPGYPDLAGFGRRAMDLSYHDIKNMVLYQAGALTAVAKALGGKVEHVKPHGALYNSAVNNMEIAAAVIDAVASLDGPALVALAGSKVVRLAREKGLRIIQEGFADRSYKPDGSLLGRKFETSVITDPTGAAENVVRMVKENRIICHSGEEISVHVDTVCVHSDNRKALEIIKEIRAALYKNEIMLLKPSHEL
ncbi:MAG: 5-oxoprolinase subunit PxpA [Eubacteriales bacterium]